MKSGGKTSEMWPEDRNYSIFAPIRDRKFKVGSPICTPSSPCPVSLGKKEELGTGLIINSQLFNKVLLHNHKNPNSPTKTQRIGFGELLSCQSMYVYMKSVVWHTYRSPQKSQGALPARLSSVYPFYINQ